MVKYFAAHPGKLDSVFDLEDGFSKTIWMNNCIETLRKDPASAKMLDERCMRQEYNLYELLKLPKNSLAYTYVTLIKSIGLQVHFYKSRDRPNLDDLSDYYYESS